MSVSSSPKALPIALKEFFGLKEGQTLRGFQDEYKALSADDRVWFSSELSSLGFNIVSSPAKAAA